MSSEADGQEREATASERLLREVEASESEWRGHYWAGFIGPLAECLRSEMAALKTSEEQTETRRLLMNEVSLELSNAEEQLRSEQKETELRGQRWMIAEAQNRKLMKALREAIYYAEEELKVPDEHRVREWKTALSDLQQRAVGVLLCTSCQRVEHSSR